MTFNEIDSPVLTLERSELPMVDLFEKRTIVELSDSDLAEIQGGSTPVCVSYAVGSAIAATVFLATVAVGYFSS